MIVTASASSPARIVGLDAWRVLLMLGGFLVHGGLWQGQQPLFTVVETVSQAFRMGCFFALSGYVCGLSMRRHPRRSWLVRRLVQVGLPMLFGWVMLCPLIWLIARSYPAMAPPLPFDWHHLWFLAALMLYAPGGHLLDTLDRRFGMVARVAAMCDLRRSILSLLLGIAALSFVMMYGTAMLVRASAPAWLVPMLVQTRNITGYAPEYLLGLTMARSPLLTLAIQGGWRAAVLLLAAVGLGFLLLRVAGPLPDPARQAQMQDLFGMLAASLCPPAVFVLIFRSAVARAQLPSIVRRLCDASLTMYLLHLPLLLAVNGAAAPLGLHPYARYGLAIGVSAGLAFALHVGLIRRVPLLALIVNGQIGPWPRTVVAGPVQDRSTPHLPGVLPSAYQPAPSAARNATSSAVDTRPSAALREG